MSKAGKFLDRCQEEHSKNPLRRFVLVKDSRIDDIFVVLNHPRIIKLPSIQTSWVRVLNAWW